MPVSPEGVPSLAPATVDPSGDATEAALSPSAPSASLLAADWKVLPKPAAASGSGSTGPRPWAVPPRAGRSRVAARLGAGRASIPEPASILLLLTGVAGFAARQHILRGRDRVAREAPARES
jgi:hypothetical protein